jgi:hypothetical protein
MLSEVIRPIRLHEEATLILEDLVLDHQDLRDGCATDVQLHEISSLGAAISGRTPGSVPGHRIVELCTHAPVKMART